MKTNILKSVFFVALTVGAFSSCVNDDDYNTPVLDCTQPNLTANRTVQQVIDASGPLVAPYAFVDDVIEAYVVSSDESGNFYKSISFQTLATATTPAIGFSVPIDATNTYIDYRPGNKVYIKMKDLYTDIIYGSMRIGGIYVNTSGQASVGRLPVSLYKQRLIASCTNVSEDDLVKHVTVTELLNDANLNTLLEVSGVQFEDAALGRHYYESTNDIGGATNWKLTDITGRTVIFRTSSFADFAGSLIPSGNGTVRGVLTKYNADYQFVARSEDDINLNGARLVPLFQETFSANFPLWTKFSVVGPQVWTLDTTFGNPGSCAKMSGFSGGNIANEDWLISPAIDLSTVTSATLTFDTATKFAGNALEIMVSTNYSAGSPATATWTAVTGTLSPSTGSYIWTASGPINVSTLTGNSNVRVAFKYTSTTSAAATWEVDNVKILGN